MLTYPARINKEDDTFLVTFPDLENVITFGLTIEEARQNAEDALNGCLASDFERNFSIPGPSNITEGGIHPITVAPHIAVAIMLRQLRGDKSRKRSQGTASALSSACSHSEL